MIMKYMVDAKSLMEFKAKRDMKKGVLEKNYSDIRVTCTNHSTDKAVPKILTKEGYKCVVCNKS